jgi:hypothetical protein
VGEVKGNPTCSQWVKTEKRDQEDGILKWLHRKFKNSIFSEGIKTSLKGHQDPSFSAS